MFSDSSKQKSMQHNDSAQYIGVKSYDSFFFIILRSVNYIGKKNYSHTPFPKIAEHFSNL